MSCGLEKCNSPGLDLVCLLSDSVALSRAVAQLLLLILLAMSGLHLVVQHMLIGPSLLVAPTAVHLLAVATMFSAASATWYYFIR